MGAHYCQRDGQATYEWTQTRKRNTMSMEFHEVANIFPVMNDEEFAALVADIRDHGQIEPIWTYQDKIIDGRNRYRACSEAGREPEFREWAGDERALLSFVMSMNLQRRHLT